MKSSTRHLHAARSAFSSLVICLALITTNGFAQNAAAPQHKTIPADILKPMQLDYTEARIWQSPPVKFAPELIECVRIGAEKSGFSSRDIISGAGHDAAYVARVAPTTMIFVPCRGGISHNETEYAAPEHCSAGAQVLLQAVLAYDRLLEERLSRRVG